MTDRRPRDADTDAAPDAATATGPGSAADGRTSAEARGRGDADAAPDPGDDAAPDPMQDPRKDPADWVTGDEPMTGPQRSYLQTLSREAGESMDENLSKADASRRIDELQARTGRGASGSSGED